MRFALYLNSARGYFQARTGKYFLIIRRFADNYQAKCLPQSFIFKYAKTSFLPFNGKNFPGGSAPVFFLFRDEKNIFSYLSSEMPTSKFYFQIRKNFLFALNFQNISRGLRPRTPHFFPWNLGKKKLSHMRLNLL